MYEMQFRDNVQPKYWCYVKDTHFLIIYFYTPQELLI